MHYTELWRKVPYVYSSDDFCKKSASCVVVLMIVAKCFEYSERPAYLKSLYSKVYKTRVKKFLRTIRGQQCHVGMALHS